MNIFYTAYQALILSPAISKLLENHRLLVRHGIPKIIVIPGQIAEKFLHFFGVVSAFLLRYYVYMP